MSSTSDKHLHYNNFRLETLCKIILKLAESIQAILILFKFYSIERTLTKIQCFKLISNESREPLKRDEKTIRCIHISLMKGFW